MSPLTLYLARRSIHGLLGSGDGVNSGHEALNNLEVVVDDLGQGSEAVGGARSIGNDLHARVVLLKVHANNEHGCIGTGCGDDHLLGASLKMSLLAPWNVLWVTFLEDLDLVAVDDQAAIFGLDFTLVATMSGVVDEHVDHVIQWNEGVIDRHDLGTLLEGSPEHKATNAAKTVDSNLRHISLSYRTRGHLKDKFYQRLNSTNNLCRDFGGEPADLAGCRLLATPPQPFPSFIQPRALGTLDHSTFRFHFSQVPCNFVL
ncbi:hypothetical protein B566_EDAN002539 [Ephemera danica]|nr:hypothetical protein B566_EDAN002539 [Ephemera danica]